MNKNSLIQIGGPEKGQCGMRAEASLNQNHHAAPAHLSLFSLPPKPQLEQELPYLYPELDASVGDVSLDTVGDVSLDTVGDVSLDEMKACSWRLLMWATLLWVGLAANGHMMLLLNVSFLCFSRGKQCITLLTTL